MHELRFDKLLPAKSHIDSPSTQCWGSSNFPPLQPSHLNSIDLTNSTVFDWSEEWRTRKWLVACRLLGAKISNCKISKIETNHKIFLFWEWNDGGSTTTVTFSRLHTIEDGGGASCTNLIFGFSKEVASRTLDDDDMFLHHPRMLSFSSLIKRSLSSSK